MTTRTFERRQFLAGLAAAPVAIAGCSHVQSLPPAAAVAPPADLWTWVRGEFAVSPDWLHFAGFLLASHPRRVRDAIEAHRSGLDDNPPLYAEQRIADLSPMQKPAAAYMGAAPEQHRAHRQHDHGPSDPVPRLAAAARRRGADDLARSLLDPRVAALATERSGASRAQGRAVRGSGQASVAHDGGAIEHALAPADTLRGDHVGALGNRREDAGARDRGRGRARERGAARRRRASCCASTACTASASRT